VDKDNSGTLTMDEFLVLVLNGQSAPSPTGPALGTEQLTRARTVFRKHTFDKGGKLAGPRHGTMARARRGLLTRTGQA
jgi:hypothetical protein